MPHQPEAITPAGVTGFDRLLCAIVATRERISPDRAAVIGISGIDASGKGYVTARLGERSRELGWNVAIIGGDDWLNLPEVCFGQGEAGEHFYKHAMRFDEMFGRLVVPLRQTRAADLVADCWCAGENVHRPRRYSFSNVDILLVEGIFLFQSAHRDHFDFTAWIECSYSTALRRAIARGQEGLDPAETERAFETIYFPAQRVHLERDKPREAADMRLVNDEL